MTSSSSSDHPLPTKVSGLTLLLVVSGCGVALASLWRPWAVGVADFGEVPRESGWAWMAYGDVLLVVTCAIVLAVALEICARPRRHATGLGIAAVLLVVCAMLGTLVVAALTAATSSDFGTVEYRAGQGPVVALTGLAMAAAGIVVAMIAAAPRNRAVNRTWHLPHLRHPHTHGM